MLAFDRIPCLKAELHSSIKKVIKHSLYELLKGSNAIKPNRNKRLQWQEISECDTNLTQNELNITKSRRS